MNRIHLRNLAGSRLLPAAFAIVTLGTGALAQAGGPTAATATITRTATVGYSDLNLSTEQGNHALFQRLTLAASNVCPVEDIRDLVAMQDARACRSNALKQAVSDLHNERLAAILRHSRAAG
ncbi:MAG: UrcA family protein [Proteobacteria bacterium]|nr:UrcA family protein [Pseudomonadota bacterium]